MTGVYAKLAELRSRLAECESRRSQIREERGALALAAERDDAAVKRRAELRLEIADLELRIADIREAIPPAERIARAEAQRRLQERKRASLARTAEALAAYDAAAAELAPLVEGLAARIADMDRRAENVVRNLRGVISADQFQALHAQPVFTHIIARLVRLGVLRRDMLPAEWDCGIQLTVPPLDQATRVWSRRVQAYVVHALAALAPPEMDEAA